MINTLIEIGGELAKEAARKKIEAHLNGKLYKINELEQTRLSPEASIENHLATAENADIEMSEKFRNLAPNAPLYETHPNWLKMIQNEFDNSLKGVEGYENTKMKTLSENPNSARGHFAELVRAYRTQRSGLDVVAIGKNVETKLGKTDIDILARNEKGELIWIENKDVKNISLNEDFMSKINKMENGLKEGVIDSNGNEINIGKTVFVNNKNISPNAIKYAEESGIHIKQNMNGKLFETYIKRVSDL